MPITAALAMMEDGSTGIVMPEAEADRGRRGMGRVLYFLLIPRNITRSISEASFQDFELSHRLSVKTFRKEGVHSIWEGRGTYCCGPVSPSACCFFVWDLPE